MKTGIRRRWFLGLVAVFLLVAAAWFLMWSISAAHMYFLACPEGYSLSASRAECRKPRILEIGALVLGLSGVAAAVFAIRNRKDD